MNNITNDKGKSCVFWIKALVIVFVVNAAALAAFTAITNSKLNEAIELAKPQEGRLTMVSAASCRLCRDFSPQKNTVEAQNVDITEYKNVSAESSEGKTLIGKYGITKLPALVFESVERIKTPLRNALAQNGKASGDNAIVWEQNSPPYFDVASAETKGLVDVTLVSDGECDECSSADILVQLILNRMGIVPASKTELDSSEKEGSALVKQYEITKIPAMVLSPEAGEYEQLSSAWNRIGSVEKDGSFVFRKPEALRLKYINLETGKVEGGQKS